MPDLLVVTADYKLSSAVEDIARGRGMRVKSAVDIAGAFQWLQHWQFDAICADADIPISEQERLAEALWKLQPIAPFVVIDRSARNQAQVEPRLFGADVVFGAGALQSLGVILERLKSRPQTAMANVKVMVVDDLDSPRDIICSFVETMGFGQVQGCRSAKEALELLTAEPTAYFCVITDMRMPDISGEQLIEQIRRHPKLQHIPVVVLTAYGSADTLLGCLRAGASGFLVKPPKRSDMARELGRAYRIAMREGSPRLASPDEVEMLRGVLEQRGFS